MIFGPNLVQERSEGDLDPPADVLPVLPRFTELKGFRAFPTVGLRDADCRYPRVYERNEKMPSPGETSRIDS